MVDFTAGRQGVQGLRGDAVTALAEMRWDEEVSRARVVQVAREWIGTPYHHRARIKGAGVDCGQLVAGVFEEAGLIPPLELEQYPHDWMLHRSEPRFQMTVERYAEEAVRAPRPGDIVLYRFGRCISHGAIVEEIVDAGVLIIHSKARCGVIRSNMTLEPELTQRFAGYWRLKGWT